MKTIIKIVLALVVLIAIALAIVFTIVISQSDNIVKAAIEKGGTYATQTATTVDDVNLGLFDGTFSMSGLNIANPDGFDSEHFLFLQGTSVKLDTASLASETISIPTVTFDGLDIILDKGNDPSNYNTILASLKRFESTDSTPATDNADGSGGKKISIDSLTLSDIDIRVANMPGVSLLTGDVAINIPSIELKDIGKDKPMTAAEITNLVIKTVLTAAVEAGGGILPTDILGELGNGLGALTSLSDMGITAIGSTGQIVGEQIGNVLQGAGVVVDDLAGNAADAVEDLTKDLPENLGDDLGNAVEDAADEVKKGLDKLNPFGKKDDD